MQKQEINWLHYLASSLKQLTEGESLLFSDMTPSKIPKKSGVYLISVNSNEGTEVPYYIGRSKNLRQRLYNNHLMGPLTNARLKKYLINSKECRDIKAAKQFIRERCMVRWLFESDTRKRGAIEGYVTGVMFPKYGIYEEH